AYDFGYASAGQVLDRISRAFESMKKLERFRGHFLNWYDTRLLKPLQPMYVSTVDSGNLAGYLLTLRPGLLDLAEARILPERVFRGLADTLNVITDAIREAQRRAKPSSNGRVNSETLARIEHLRRDLKSPPRTLTAARMLLQRFA